MFGKWHLGSPNTHNNMSADTLPLAHGFDQWIGTNVSHDYDNSQLLQSDPQGDAPIKEYKRLAMNLPSDRDASISLTTRYTQEATKFIEANKEQPFFAYLAYNQPHLGLYASEKFTGTSRRGLLGDVMAEIDDAIAQVLQSIEKSGITRNTLVIFSSDNGPWILYQNVVKNPKYGEARLHVGYAQPFRDGKGSNWEGGHRVPGIFYWPGVIEPRHQLEPASTLDVLPTVLQLCGVDVPKNIDGRDIRQLLSATRFTQAVAPFSFAYSGDNNLPNAYREGPWKLHVKLISQTGDFDGFSASLEKPLLFQIEHDLGERIDRAAEHPEIVERLRTKLTNLTESLKTTP
jgi:arylsulfatase